MRLLGAVDVVVDGTRQHVTGLRRKALLGVLALQRGRIVSTDRLVELVWGDAAPAGALNNLQRTVSYLRQMLADRRAIEPRERGYVLALPPGSVDVELAESLVEQAARSAVLTERAQLAQMALALWHGPSLVDVDRVPWLAAQARRLDELWLRATHTMVDSRMALGEHARLLPDLERLAREHPLDERLSGQLILALYRNGRQADALAAFQRVRRTLVDELGIDPSPELRNLEAAILRQDPALRHSPGPAVAPASLGHRPAGALLPAAAPGGPGAGTIRLGTASLVGRGDELAALRGTVDAVARDTGAAVFIVGEPGIGKTRLAAEVAGFAEQRGMTVLRGRAATPSVQFRALSEALMSVLRRSDLPDDPDLLPYGPALARLVPDLPYDPAPDRPAETQAPVDDTIVVLAEAVLRLVAALGRCVLVLEDLHDADADTLAVVDYLLDNAASHRMLLLCTLRANASPALRLLHAARARRTAGVVELARLDDAAVRELAGACLGVAAREVPGTVIEGVLSAADGVPLHVEELLADAVGHGALAWAGGRWTVTGRAADRVPASLGAILVGRVDRLSPAAAAVLRAAAMLGRRFPAVAAGAAAQVDTAKLVVCLRELVDHQFLVPEDNPHWYAFRHVLMAEAICARLLPVERVSLARRAAESIEVLTADPFLGADQLAAELWYVAGEPARAAKRFLAAGRAAFAQGALSSAIALLERALSMVDGEVSVEVGEALVNAYAVAGRVADAYSVGERFGAPAVPGSRANIHLHLARAAVAAGDWERGTRALAQARRDAGPRPALAMSARMDAVEAELTFGNPGAPNRLTSARRLAGRALRLARATGQPEVSCSALNTLGRCARLRDLARAEALYERGLAIAEAHGLAAWRINLLYHLGADQGIRHADTGRLAEALVVAEEAGAIVTALDIEQELSIVRLCRAEFAAAEESARRREEAAARLRLSYARLIALGTRVMIAAHRARWPEVAALATRFRDLGGEETDFSTAVRGLGIAFCHLLHEDRTRALAELEEARAQEARRPASYLSFIHGPHLLLAVLAGRAGATECADLSRSAHMQARWNRQFLVLAEALVHGRAGRLLEANLSIARFAELSQPFPLAAHLGRRLVAPEAIEMGWGDPISWLCEAEVYFHDSAPHVAHACHKLLREAGAFSTASAPCVS